MIPRAGWAPVAFAAALLVGCSVEAAIGPAAEVIDSAGVRIVTYDLTDVVVPTYANVGEYDLGIGVLDGSAEYTFSSIIDVRISDDGSIIVSDGGDAEIRVFDSNGLYSRTLGRRGGGPGEFAAGPLIAGIAGDTVSDVLAAVLTAGPG